MVRERLPLTHFEVTKNHIQQYDPLFFDKKNRHLTVDKWIKKTNKIALSLTENRHMLDYLDGWEDIVYKTYKTYYFFNYNGRKIFRFSPAITKELCLTNIDNVDDSFLECPFPVICFEVPKTQLLTLLGNSIKWIYLSITKINEIRTLHIVINADTYLDTQKMFTFKGGKIKEQLDAHFDFLKTFTDVSFAETVEEDFYKIVTFITASLLYINTKDADLKMIVPRILSKKTDSTIPICSVGDNIIINRDFNSPGGDNKEHIIHVLKWSVRGHFRNQPCGNGRTEKKLTWIRPYLKGKERLNEDVKAKPTAGYVVK